MNLRHSTVCLLAVLISLLLLVNAATALAEASMTMTVKVGKSVILRPGDKNVRYRYVTISDPDIIEIPKSYEPTYLQINGKKIGSTNLLVWEDNAKEPTFYTVNVVGDEDLIETQVRELSPNDAIRVQYARDTVLLTGTVANEVTAKKAEEIAKAYSAKVVNHITVNQPLQVLLQVKVAQVDKTALKNLGISFFVKGNTAEGFSNLIGAPLSATTTKSSILSTLTGTTSSSVTGAPGINGTGPSGLGGFNPLDTFQAGVSYFPAGIAAVLQALTTKGLAKLLAEPNLLVKSGLEGDFLAGSEIPYSVLTNSGGSSTPSIIYKTVGVKLRFKPEVQDNGLINLKIDPAEVSSIAGTLAVNGYPIIDTRDVRTSVELRDGESLVLAGLLQEEKIKTMSKIPLMGDIPILGALFRSTSDQIKSTELIFVITPRLVAANPPGSTVQLPTERTPDPDKVKELDWLPLGK
ncbi:type II and III secretion system protein family protein [Geomonas sp.]|uniref:type II and III secretion system protein family protein n=1 Tax=Geomonas sp. TaxID=2651584 RepID=UPI002B47FE3D|nr:pilus assembly protein N-terminal domain-containing protein [Geomonas sp.]HJV35016.1 pilus assembly protein N-terminal domain-containing protein [Geomonas sp.]